MSKVAKSKRKSRSKNGKIGKCAEGQDNEYTDSFPNYDSRPLRGFRRLSMFLYQGLHKEKGNLAFIIMYGTFWLDGDFFVRNLYASVELRQYQSLSQRNLFLILTEFFSSLFFPFFTKVSLPLLIFP